MSPESAATLSPFALHGRVAVVTGAGGGIGFEIARALARQGATIVACGRTARTLDDAVGTIKRDGGQAEAVVVDVSREDEVAQLAAHVGRAHRQCDVLVNNAAVNLHYAFLEDTNSEQYHQIVDVNLHGAFYCSRELGRIMLAQSRGSIINISSIGGSTGLRKQVPYCVSKGGLEQLTRTLAVDWASRGVRVNAIAYGYIETEFSRGPREHEHISKRLLARTPMGRFGRLDEVAGAAVFLSSDASSYVTGHVLAVDGGWCAG